MSAADALNKLIEEVPSVGDLYLKRYLLDNAEAIRDVIVAAEAVLNGDTTADRITLIHALAKIKEQP